MAGTSKFPTALDDSSTLYQPGAGDLVASIDHAALHDNASVAAIAIETKLGIGASTPTANKVLRATGTGTTAYGQVVLTTDVTGTLPVANGGTGATSSTGTNNVVLSTSPTLTTPVMSSIVNSGTLTLPTSTDTLVGRATTDTLTNKSIDGGSNTVTGLGTGALATNAVQANQLATNAITLGYSSSTSAFTLSSSQGTQTQVTNLSVTVTIPAGGRRVKITVFTTAMTMATAGDFYDLQIWDGTINSGTLIQKAVGTTLSSGFQPVCMVAVVSPSAGSKTYNVSVANDSGARNVTVAGASTNPSFILVEAI